MAAPSLATTTKRSIWAIAFTLLLALRLLGATGYMPAFDHGAVAIVTCPDADETAPLAISGAHHHNGSPKHHHQPCPYAAASALGGLTGDMPLLSALLVLGVALLVGRPYRVLERHRAHDRPPLRGPPILA